MEERESLFGTVQKAFSLASEVILFSLHCDTSIICQRYIKKRLSLYIWWNSFLISRRTVPFTLHFSYKIKLRIPVLPFYITSAKSATYNISVCERL
jgi:hypothetical protein